MRLISAKYDDMCLSCGGRIKSGQTCWWSAHQTYHEKCYIDTLDESSVKAKWLKSQY